MTSRFQTGSGMISACVDRCRPKSDFLSIYCTVPESVKAGNLSIPDVLDVPLAPGEVKLLSLRSQKLNEHTACIQPAMQVGLKWVEAVAVTNTPAR